MSRDLVRSPYGRILDFGEIHLQRATSVDLMFVWALLWIVVGAVNSAEPPIVTVEGKPTPLVQTVVSAVEKFEQAMQAACAPDLPLFVPAPLKRRDAAVLPWTNGEKSATHRRFAQTQLGPFDDLILASALRWGLDPFLLRGLLANESKLQPLRFGKRSYGKHKGTRVVISGGAVGIAQFSRAGIRAVDELRQKRRQRGELTLGFDLGRALEPQEAIPAAAEFLAYLIDRYGRDGGITAYNTGLAGGAAVSRLGFWRARRAGKLKRAGAVLLQGDRFLLNVLEHTNRYRVAAGLPPVHGPDGVPMPFDGTRLAQLAGVRNFAL